MSCVLSSNWVEHGCPAILDRLRTVKTNHQAAPSTNSHPPRNTDSEGLPKRFPAPDCLYSAVTTVSSVVENMFDSGFVKNAPPFYDLVPVLLGQRGHASVKLFKFRLTPFIARLFNPSNHLVCN